MSLLYHYTSIDAFMGIFGNCTKANQKITIWATHSMYLNDPTEFKLGKDICRETLLEVENELDIPFQERLSNRIYSSEEMRHQDVMDQVYSTIPEKIHWGMPYVISLSQNRDNLPMWNTYGCNGQGIALGFNKYRLIDSEGLVVKKCCYNTFLDEEYKALYLRIKDSWQSLYNNRGEIERSNVFDLIYDSIRLTFRDEMPFVKHYGYQYEDEIRCIAKPYKNTKIQYRSANNMIVPYIERQIDIKCLEQIIIGPCADKERFKASLTSFLYDKIEHLDRIKIIESDIPYRG